MTEPGAGTGQQGQHGGAPSGGPDTTMSLHPVGTPEAVETPESGLSTADRSAIEALPEGSALLVVQRGPNSGARFLLDSEKTTAGRHPDSDIFLDDVTVSRRHAEFLRRASGEFAVRDVGSLNGTYVQPGPDRRGRPAGRRRGPDRQVPDGLPPEPAERRGRRRGVTGPWPTPPRAGRHGPRASMSIGEVLTALRPDFPDVTISKIRFLEARGSDRPRAHPVRVPQVRPCGRRAAAVRAARAAGPLPAPAGHPGSPRRAGRRPRPAAAAGRRPRVPRLVPDMPAPEPRRPLQPARAAGRRERGGAARRARVLRSDRPAPRTGVRRRGPGGSCAPLPDSRGSASSRGTCVPSGPRRTARPAWWSRSWRRCGGSADPRPRGAPTRRLASWRRCPCACTRPSCRAPCSAPHRDFTRSRSAVRGAVAPVGNGRYGGGVRELDVVGVRVEMPSNQPIVLLREARRRPLPADLDRGGRGDGDRLRTAGDRPAAPADPRPVPDVLEALGRSSPRCGSRTCADASSTRSWCSTAASRSAPGRPTPSRWPCAPVRRSTAADGVLDDGGHRHPGRAGGRGGEVPRVPRPDLAGGLRRAERPVSSHRADRSEVEQ